MESKALKVGCHAFGGHQILKELKEHPLASLSAVSCISREELEKHIGEDAASVKICESLDELLKQDIDLVSICSPRRDTQADEAIAALAAGKHVLAEKPAALTMRSLDSVLKAAEKSGRLFREMGGTELQPPFPEIKFLVDSGAIGQVVQTWAMKSYPFHASRPQDQGIDGGIIQAGLHAIRFTCHSAGLRIKDIYGGATHVGNPVPGGQLQMAAALHIRYEGGQVGSLTVNYLNQPKLGFWGNDQLKIFGTSGIIEVFDGLTSGRIVDADGVRPLSTPGKETDKSYFTRYAELILDGSPMPTAFEQEVEWMRYAILAMDALRK